MGVGGGGCDDARAGTPAETVLYIAGVPVSTSPIA